MTTKQQLSWRFVLGCCHCCCDSSVAFFGVFVVADCLVVVVVVIRIVSRKGALEFLFAVVCSLVFGSALPACLPKDLSRVSHGQTTVTVHVIYIYNNHSSFNLSLLSPSCPDAIYVSIQFYKVCVEKYEGRSLQRFREISPSGDI